MSVNLRGCQTKRKTCGCWRILCGGVIIKHLAGQDISKYGVIRKCLRESDHPPKMPVMTTSCNKRQMFIKGNFRKNGNSTQTKCKNLGNRHDRLFSELMDVYLKLQVFGPIAGWDYIMGQSDISSLLYNCHF